MPRPLQPCPDPAVPRPRNIPVLALLRSCCGPLRGNPYGWGAAISGAAWWPVAEEGNNAYVRDSARGSARPSPHALPETTGGTPSKGMTPGNSTLKHPRPSASRTARFCRHVPKNPPTRCHQRPPAAPKLPPRARLLVFVLPISLPKGNKGLGLYGLTPCFLMVGAAGFEPATP